MNLDDNFKLNCIRAYKGSEFLNPLIEAIDNKQNNALRWILESGLDDESLKITETLKDEGDMLIANSKISILKMRNEVYSQFMELLNNELDLAVNQTYIEQLKLNK